MHDLIRNITFILLLNITHVLSWTTAAKYGIKCRFDSDCSGSDVTTELVCTQGDPRTCRCHFPFDWDINSKRCYATDEETFTTKFDPVKDLIIPGIIVMTIGAMVYLGIKLFCNCGKLWRRRRRRLDLPRELDEPPPTPATWVASYRVFSSLNGMDPRTPSGLSPPGATGFSMHPTPCMGLFVPSSHLAATASPPSYEEALKHKVILSSYPGVIVGGSGVSPPSSQDHDAPHGNP